MAPLEDLTPARALPPGVYFSPTKPESVLNYLDRWMAGYAMPDADGLVIEADVYAENPDVLTSRHRPASIRDGEPSWWFICLCKMQDTRGRPRGQRTVAKEGTWKLEQSKEDVKGAEPGSSDTLGVRRNFGFYVHAGKNESLKTVWLMEEYTSVACPEDGVDMGDGKKVLPVLCRIYLSPRDPGRKEEKNRKKKRRRDDDGEDDGEPRRPVRAMVPAAYFDAIAALLPPASVRGVVHQDQTHATQEAPPPLLLLGVSDPYQGGGDDASPVDDDHHTMNAVPETYAMPEERQGNTDDGESSQQRDLLLVDEGKTVSRMGRDDDFADSSWIDELLDMAMLPSSSQEQSMQEDPEEAPPPPLPGVSDSYQGYTMPEEGQANTNDDDESPQQQPVNEGMPSAWQMDRFDVLADSSWIDEHY